MREAYGRLWAFLFGWMRFFIAAAAAATPRSPRAWPYHQRA
jgi:hypothetical protein